jgi:DDE_Tnp_1-associated
MAPGEVVLANFIACWNGLDDPRTRNAALHDVHEILAIALCAVLCGGQGSADMGLFAKSKEPFLRGFLKLENGVPSHDTFSRLFRMLDPEQFRAVFQQFMQGFSHQCAGVVAVDGKVLRRSFDKASGKSPLHMVSAWGCEQRLVLAQIATDTKSNEITAVPKLLRRMEQADRPTVADWYKPSAEFGCPVVERRLRPPIFARQVSSFRAGLLLQQNPDDLLFCEQFLLHRVRPAMGRTLIDTREISQGQVNPAWPERGHPRDLGDAMALGQQPDPLEMPREARIRTRHVTLPQSIDAQIARLSSP